MMPPILRMAIGQSTIRMMYPQQKMIGMNLIGFHRIGDVLVDFDPAGQMSLAGSFLHPCCVIVGTPLVC